MQNVVKKQEFTEKMQKTLNYATTKNRMITNNLKEGGELSIPCPLRLNICPDEPVLNMDKK